MNSGSTPETTSETETEFKIPNSLKDPFTLEIFAILSR
jgi:hypothetical protein